MAVYEWPYEIEKVMGKGAYYLKGRNMFNIKDLKKAHLYNH